jgi:hypothetical protein
MMTDWIDTYSYENEPYNHSVSLQNTISWMGVVSILNEVASHYLDQICFLTSAELENLHPWP